MTTTTTQQLNSAHLSVISFNSKGVLKSYCSIPTPLSRHRIQRYVKIFLASLSISEAFLSSPPQQSQTDSDNRIASRYRKATAVLCDVDTLLIGASLRDDENEWIAVAGRPCVLHNVDLEDALLVALHHAGFDISSSSYTSFQSQSYLHHLWTMLSEIFTASTSLRDEQLIRHIWNAFIQLAKRYLYATAQTNIPDKPTVPPSKQVQHCIDQFCEASASLGTQQSLPFCLLDSSAKVLYSHSLPNRKANHLAWYYEFFVGTASRFSNGSFLQWIDDTCMYAWFKRRGHVLCVQLNRPVSAAPSNTSAIRNSAARLIDCIITQSKP